MKPYWLLAFGVLGGLLAAGLLLIAIRPPRGHAVELLPPPTPAPLVIHVAGAVNNPGVYSLPIGSRVQEAVKAAGGFSNNANLQAINLAAALEDGMQIFVPDLKSDNLTENSPSMLQPLININTATLEELESLPQIGPKMATRIIQYRQEHGPFQTIENIQEVDGIGSGIFEGIKDLITVASP